MVVASPLFILQNIVPYFDMEKDFVDLCFPFPPRIEMEERVTMMSEEIHSNTLAVKDMLSEGDKSTTSMKDDLQKAIENTQEHLRRLAADRIPVGVWRKYRNFS